VLASIFFSFFSGLAADVPRFLGRLQLGLRIELASIG
jgi:hypothetical protein